METCRMCGARLSDENELERHNKSMHPNMAGKKGGLVKEGREPEKDRPIDQPYGGATGSPASTAARGSGCDTRGPIRPKPIPNTSPAAA